VEELPGARIESVCPRSTEPQAGGGAAAERPIPSRSGDDSTDFGPTNGQRRVQLRSTYPRPTSAPKGVQQIAARRDTIVVEMLAGDQGQ